MCSSSSSWCLRIRQRSRCCGGGATWRRSRRWGAAIWRACPCCSAAGAMLASTVLVRQAASVAVHGHDDVKVEQAEPRLSSQALRQRLQQPCRRARHAVPLQPGAKRGSTTAASRAGGGKRGRQPPGGALGHRAVWQAGLRAAAALARDTTQGRAVHAQLAGLPAALALGAVSARPHDLLAG